ncbi:MAG TPA: cytochrome c oxidase accessory protein CcoG [Amaricoccus sp.]|uniref:cytochrome c oxidase accessory protein CcoG n=1 Tax=Amaricoccus sp. TaxID=1872485 RepID=UPI002C240815|nr:cytochrome c oxidase accessory protein CcoG [Amaricoccus sp.]HMQ94433.1 cytochrome c oxidase accessory protein CcoG [Amaricoccus sp.]HMR53507.1 cytochrome c oxidase accessory protein CcoG [Amaricoccus sp.]HMR61521.1 cytochrome c oxidase accessory protein CcoG [Amaricoccus sp.]HMU00633.1 cytochrome c oxidase accessory protein CcoG [Amaricoccus sp.]
MTSTSETPPPLFAAREPIFPRRVSGKFRTLKWWILGVTLAIYYITPWIRWDRGPSLPDQAVLVDLANRRFYFFFIEIWPQEFYFVAGLLIMAGLGLFLFTSALGRVWCGYTCPQTVWTDLFILVERWIEGDRNARVRLWNAPWDTKKIRLRATKWGVWLLIAVATGGAWVFYFADAPTLLGEILTGRAPAVAYLSVATLTATTFTFGGFMREQVCIYMCPWPRIQGAMMDEQTLTVAYRDWRGEPRGKHRKAAGAEQLGDCIDCNACVNVCPMGIDIRDGQQLACITCALCIDACDDVMEKVNKPRGLIDYITLADGERERAGGQDAPVWKQILRPRVILYFVLWSAIGLGLLAALFLRTDVAFSIEPVRNPVNVVLSDGSVRNAYELRLRNMTGFDRAFRLSVESPDPVALTLEGVEGLDVSVPADATYRQRVYLTAPPGSAAGAGALTDLDLVLEDTNTGQVVREGTVFHGTGE